MPQDGSFLLFTISLVNFAFTASAVFSGNEVISAFGFWLQDSARPHNMTRVKRKL
jgi:hypothetical protein